MLDIVIYLLKLKMTQNCWHECWGLMAHLLFIVFLHCTVISMVIPPLIDVTMSALCPGVEQCIPVIYLTSFCSWELNLHVLCDSLHILH